MAAPGDFSFIASASWRGLLEDAYTAVTVSNAWDFFRTQAPPEDKGYMFWDTPELTAITKNMKCANEHSGASFASTMRVMQSIALMGWDAWAVARQNPFAEAQEKVIKSIKEEPIDTGFHNAWLMRKAYLAREMTEESMNEILLGPEPMGLTDATAKYTVAKQIQSLMKSG